MLKRLEEKEVQIEQVIEELHQESACGILILVEGKKDVDALRTLGVTGPILTIKTGGKTLVQTLMEIEEMGTKEIILLLDFDTQGKKLTHRLKQDLERARIKSNLHFWSVLKGLLGREVQCIESITAYLMTLRRKLE